MPYLPKPSLRERTWVCAADARATACPPPLVRVPPRMHHVRAAQACMFISCMFISTVEFRSAVSFGGELRGDLASVPGVRPLAAD
jgi:hypothetical protein